MKKYDSKSRISDTVRYTPDMDENPLPPPTDIIPAVVPPPGNTDTKGLDAGVDITTAASHAAASTTVDQQLSAADNIRLIHSTATPGPGPTTLLMKAAKEKDTEAERDMERRKKEKEIEKEMKENEKKERM